jgi:hypothetical protein
MTPIVFLCALYGSYRSVRERSTDGLRHRFHVLSLYICATWLFFLAVHWAWTTRLLFPLVVLLLPYAGYGLACIDGVGLRRASFAACVALSVALTAAVFGTSRDKWSDVLRAAHFVRDEVPVFASVSSNDPTKTRFWSGRSDVEWYRRNALSPGAYVVLQSQYSDLEKELSYLRRHFDVDVLFGAESTVRNLLSDESNRLEAPAGLLARTRNQSIVLHLTAP